MNDTKQRIAEYKKQLPGLKERVATVALLLAISLTMVVTTSFAWIVLSRSPEVTGVSTTVASNGNLEIALVPADGSLPKDSAVGDSYAADGQSITAANLTWGNMINLSDPSYGLDNLVLRPAQLNKAALLTNPLFGAEYGQDGRIIKLNSNFAYTKWNPPVGDKPGYFGVTSSDSAYGVRAISSTKIEAVGAEATYLRMVTAAEDANLMAASQYSSLSGNSSQMQSLATMMGLYMTARMNPSDANLSNPDCSVEDIKNLTAMYEGFLEAFQMEAEAMAELLNLRAFLKFGEGKYTPYSADMMFTITNSELKAALDVEITRLSEFQKDYVTVLTDKGTMEELSNSGTTLKWKDPGPSGVSLNDIVNHLVNVGACTIGADNTPISSIGASNAMGYLSGTQEARITNGILYRFEERVGGYIEVKNLSIKATVKRSGITVPASVKANVQTTAPRDHYLFLDDLETVKQTNTGDYQGGEAVAEDTFGLAVDFWVRTNAEAHYLMLEGNVLTKTEIVRAMGTDPSGNKVELFTITRSAVDPDTGETVSVPFTLYEGEVVVLDEATGEETTVKAWYDYDTYGILELEDGEEPTPKMEEKEIVIGYEGENRVWDRDNEANKLNLSVNSTTQGSGSCYVYYADTPEDQARSLELLKAMKVAFVGADGKMMASASMDTERHYAANGKVIVPLVLDSSNSINLGENREGEELFGITALEKNVATRVTAIVYLDGMHLNNQDVLAAASIQGQLNIQFGTYADDLKNMENEQLKGQELTVAASVDKTKMDYDTAQSATDLTTAVTINVQGSQPKNVTAFFLRAINSTQGSREETMIFEKQEDGSWKANYTFTAPGNYILRSVRLDGVEYDLETRPEVLVTGFTVKSLSCPEAENRHITVLTAAGSHTVNLSLEFASHDEAKMPRSVQGRFLRDSDGSAVNIDFAYNPTITQWTGSATFLTSGNYTLQYLILDNEYVELTAEQQQTATIYLGMRVAVFTTSPHKFLYAPSEMEPNEKILSMQVKILDNAGNEMPGLSKVKLAYSMKGSGAKIMDANLLWNGSYYVGEFPMVDSEVTDENGNVTTLAKVGGPGIWQFASVTVGDRVITSATEFPTFTVLSPEPPSYHDHRTPEYQYKPNKDATLNVHIANSEAAQVMGYIVNNDTSEGVWVEGTLGTMYEYAEYEGAASVAVTVWNFAVPGDASTGHQDGNWTLSTLRLWDVFATDGTPYTEETPLEMDLTGKSIKSKVVSRVNITFLTNESNKTQNFGQNASGAVIGEFMDQYTISGLAVKITDFEGKPIEGVSNVQLTLTHGQDSANYGGYTFDTALEAISIPLTGSDQMTFGQGADVILQIAGSYATTFSYNVGSTQYSFTGTTLPLGAPVYTVSSVKPTATITAATTHSTLDGKTSSFTGTAATVYYKETTEKTCGITYYNYDQASVTISLTGYGLADSATLTFAESNNGTVYLYETKEASKNSNVNAYTWSGNGDCLRWVGYWNGQTGTDSAAAAGTIKATTLVLTKNGVTYTVDIDDITITNPVPKK